MKFILKLALFAVIFFTVIPTFAAIPAPPSQDTLNKLKELGDQNLQKYGDGGVTFVNGEYVIAPKNTPTPFPTATLTPSPTPLPTNTPTPTPTKRIEQKVADTVHQGVANLSETLSHFIYKYFLNIFFKKS